MKNKRKKIKRFIFANQKKLFEKESCKDMIMSILNKESLLKEIKAIIKKGGRLTKKYLECMQKVFLSVMTKIVNKYIILALDKSLKKMMEV
jgi:hypothetical protein